MHDYEKELEPVAPRRDWGDLVRGIGLASAWIGAGSLCTLAALAMAEWLIEVLR